MTDVMEEVLELQEMEAETFAGGAPECSASNTSLIGCSSSASILVC